MKFPATAAARLGLLWVLLWLEETSTSPIGAAASRPARNVLAGRGKAKESAAPFELRFSIVRDPNKVSFLSLSEGDGLHRLVGRNGLRVDDTSSAKLFAARDRRQAPQTSSSEATTAGGGVNDEISQAIAGALTDAFEAGKGSPAAAAGFHVNNVGVIPARDKTGYNARMQGPGARAWLNLPGSIQKNGQVLNNLSDKVRTALRKIKDLDAATLETVKLVRLELCSSSFLPGTKPKQPGKMNCAGAVQESAVCGAAICTGSDEPVCCAPVTTTGGAAAGGGGSAGAGGPVLLTGAQCLNNVVKVGKAYVMDTPAALCNIGPYNAASPVTLSDYFVKAAQNLMADSYVTNQVQLSYGVYKTYCVPSDAPGANAGTNLFYINVGGYRSSDDEAEILFSRR
eukprot:g13363.t1